MNKEKNNRTTAKQLDIYQQWFEMSQFPIAQVSV